MQAVVNAALPIFALILTGYVCGKRGLLNRAATESLNLFAVYLALPAPLFHAMTRITLEQFGQAGFAAAFAGGIALTFAVAFGLGQRGNRRLAEAGMEGLNASYGNVGFLGIPLCLLVFGESGIAPAVISTLFVGCMVFAFAIVLIEADLNRQGGAWRTARMVAVSIARNPLVIAPAFGILIGTTGVSLPAPVERFVVLLGGAASPCALVCIGPFLAQERVGGAMRTVSLLVGLKRVLQPAVTALLAYETCASACRKSGRAAVLLSALPIGSGPFTIAKLYGLDAGTNSGGMSGCGRKKFARLLGRRVQPTERAGAEIANDRPPRLNI